MRVSLFAVGLCAATALTAQSPLTTIYSGGNGLGAGSTIYFNVNLVAPLTFYQIDVNSSSAVGTPGTIEVRWCPSTYVGNDTVPASWTLGGTGPVSAAGSNNPTACTLTPFTLPPGSYGFAVTFVGIGQNYTNGNGTTTPGSGTNQTYSTAELTLTAGASTGGSPALGTGTICCNPRVFNGSLYYSVGGTGTVARSSRYGTGCYAFQSSFYENFSTSASFDLANTSFSMLPTGSGYQVIPGVSPYIAPSPNATVVTLTDDSVAMVNLSSPFVHSTGVTSQLEVCSNGFVSVATGNGTGFSPVVTTFLNAPQTGWWAQHDYNPAAAGSGTVKYEEVGPLSCITWDGVYDFGGTTATSANTFQFQFDRATGIVHVVFQTMSTAGNARLVGYSPGGASADPGNFDLSVRIPGGGISLTAADVAALSLATSARPLVGTTFNFVTTNIPAGTVLGATLLGFTQFNPGIDLGFLGAPGCSQYLTPDATLVFFASGTSFSQPFTIPNATGYLGLNLFGQSASFTSGLNGLGAIMANGVALTVGNL